MNTHAVVCNEVPGTDEIAPGALCFVRTFSTGSRSVQVDAIGRDGQWLTAWRPLGALTNFRTKFIPQQHARFNLAKGKGTAKVQAETLAKAREAEFAPEPQEETTE